MTNTPTSKESAGLQKGYELFEGCRKSHKDLTRGVVGLNFAHDDSAQPSPLWASVASIALDNIRHCLCFLFTRTVTWLIAL